MPMKLPRAEELAIAEVLTMPRALSQSLIACAVALSLGAGSAQAQEGAGGGSGVTIVPGFSVSQTATDNNRLSSTNKDAALITALTPSISIASHGGRVIGTLDYSISGLIYLKTDQQNTVQQSLTARGQAELVDKRLFVDVSATIGQQAVSAFGPQSPDRTLANPNQSEVASLYIAPYLVGRIGDLASYELRGSATATSAKDSSLGDSKAGGGSLRLDGLGGRKLGWWASLSTQRSRFGFDGAENENTVANFGLRYLPDPDLQLKVNAGPERTDYLGFLHKGENYGANANWKPSPRTDLLVDWQYHDYGNTHMISFDHRMARSAIRYADTKNVYAGNQTRSAGAGTNYDLLFLQFSSIEPDPVKRDVLVRSFLQALGLSPDAPISSGSLASAPTMTRTQQLSLSLEGLRTTMTGLLSQTTTERLGAIIPTGGDLAQSNRIVMRGGSLTIAHRLTPISSANLTLSAQRSRSDDTGLRTMLRSLIANWTTQLGPRANASLGARHSDFEGSPSYTENAVFGNLAWRF
ncbi:TIGR03016 family PEP-CTERM system-associated outer membrane protein [Roseateles violae]|uniref:TIGR03016 family PEP-CTERM system-associated outer membrane protein n=1 Tax=Roseateles violae TaxID=3058042 RepID=A0ABT8DTT7_9BURK|nr:TIGR03016 family PEP-CTERM system-associated outer membrane protein [Pelomonas sp. PFR6]MDN3920445.1 TIGR03016 family PEP-CTERM system-associated outer membrane protein [Pelomonas sp. PFR6]